MVDVLTRLALKVDAAGLRKPAAALASLAATRRRHHVDEEGRWVHAQPEATYVSPTPHIETYGEIEDRLRAVWFWRGVPGPGDTVIDVGAGIGEETVLLSKLVGPTGRVIAIEAHPAIFAALQATIARSGLRNVEAVQCAVTDVDGEITMSTDVNHVAGTTVGGAGDVVVPARSLDSLADELGLGEVAFVKMNIEGAERLAVRGMRRLFERAREVSVSCHDFLADLGQSEDFRTKREVRDVLEAAGYDIATRPDDPHPWVRDYLYATRVMAG